ncbi:hypothetical protein SAMN05443144_10271 [Fodinibius roseus]|uniref:Aminoglycoside phosphotransferase domain-containing protein n=1 Tax=Fodinibius roseus TaxID=1194090 RepID=A0A1M4ULJ8_9BACT|nr:AAA family ATPase [Fodinibius roseus]SHE57535.1 hypothetical protein SAMN05443144_10271 [Fodinibius roseus]
MSDNPAPTGLTDELLHFLKRPGSYPHAPREVRHIQTHISHVFIVPPYVYKLKKPVDFGFLDYSSLAKRRTYCHREVQLNRRLTEDIYLGVVGIARREGERGYLIGSVDQGMDMDPDSGSVVEYAVKMRKLSEEYFLHSYIEEGRLTNRHLDRVAGRLARFYTGQQQSDELSEWGAMEQVKVNTDENFSQTKRFIGETIEGDTFRAIRQYTGDYYRGHGDLFQKRREEGRIVDGHGDLHLEHIYITPEKVMVYDCIEFNDRFRYGDLAADLAFLAMDLDFNGCWREQRYFVSRMAGKLGDSDLERIITFYKCYRAYVKGKVKSLQSTEEEVPPEEREKAAGLASRYFSLSLRYALLGSDAVVVIFMGRVGTGKSTLSGWLSDRLKVSRYSSDHIRKRSMGLPLTDRTPEDQRPKLYSREMSEHTYGVLGEQAAGSDENTVILDATYSKREDRERLVEKLESSGRDYLFVEARCPDETIKERLRRREEQSGVVSDARLEDFDKLSKAYEPPAELDDSHLIPVDTNQSIEDSIRELANRLAGRNIKAN